MKNLFKVTAVLLLVMLGGAAQAGCECQCVSGEVRAICSSTLDVRPVCAPRVCPITQPSVQPIATPQVPPVGTKSCSQKQVYNEKTRQYEWREICS